MASDNINGMKAQDWKLLDTSRIDAAADQQTKLTVEQRQLLDAMASIVKAAAIDIHGTAASDDRYRYIVDLIVKRLAAVSSSSNEEAISQIKDLLGGVATDSSTEDISKKLSDLAKQLNGIDIKSLKQCIDSAAADIKFDSKFADAVASKVISQISSRDTALAKSDIAKFFDANSKKDSLAKASSMTSAQKQSAFEKMLKSTVAKSNSTLVSKIAQIGSDASGFIGIMQDSRQSTKNINDIVSKISEISTAAKSEDDDSAKAKNKEKAKQSLLMRMLKSTILNPTLKVLKVISSTLASATKKVTSFIGKGIFAALMTPPGMYAIGFAAGYVWTKWLKPFFSGKVMPFAKKVLDFFKLVGPLVDKLTKFFGIGGDPDQAGSMYSAFKAGAKTLISGIGFTRMLGAATGQAMKNGLAAVGRGVAKLFSGPAAKVAANAAKQAKAAKEAGNIVKALQQADKARRAAQELKHAADLAKGTKKYDALLKQFRQASAAAARAAKYAKEAEVASQTAIKGGKLAKFAKGALKMPFKLAGGATSATMKMARAAAGITPVMATARIAGKTAKFGMKILPGLGVAATAAFNKMELDALKEEAKKLCEQYSVSSLEELMQKYGLKDKNGNDITDEVHFAAQNLINAVENKLRTSVSDIALEGLDFIFPGIGTALQIGSNKLVKNMQEADKVRRAGLMQANKTTAEVIRSMRDQAAMSLEIKNKINGLQNSDEKQAALKERLQMLQKTKALYKKIEAQEKEAEKQLERLGSGLFSWTSSSEDIAHWQERADSLRRQKNMLLKEHGFAASDMRDKASRHRGDTDGLTEAQRLAKQIVENEIRAAGDISKEAYDMYNEAFGHKSGDYSLDKQALIDSKFADVKQAYYSQHMAHPLQDSISSIDQTLQDRTMQQQEAIQQMSDSNGKLADAIEKSSNAQKEASQQILEKLGELQLQTSRLQTSSNSSIVSIVQPQDRQNLALIESSRANTF